MSELFKRDYDCRLKKGDKIAFLPFDFLKQSIIPYGLGAQRLFIGRYYAFVEKGIICAINRIQSETDEFVPFILPLSYIVAPILLARDYYNMITRLLPKMLEHLEKLNQQPDETMLIRQKIANGVDISAAIPSNKVYTVEAVGSIKTDIILQMPAWHQPYCKSWDFTKIALSESNLTMHFNGIDCLIDNQPLNKQEFIDYIRERMLAEETWFKRSDIILPSHETITELRAQIIEQERSSLLDDYKKRLDDFKEQYIKEYKEKGYSHKRLSYWPTTYSIVRGLKDLNKDEEYNKYIDDEFVQKKVAKLCVECLSDISRQEQIIDYERQEQQKKEQEKKSQMEGWKDIGNVILFVQTRTFEGEIKFKERSINVLQVNTIRNKFRIKIDNEYRDLKRVDISTSIFKTHYVYQVEPFCHLYILEDLSKRAI